ncbi:MAG: PorV/PorQ family protein [Gemmatimonadales bacterium]|nr:PorV/PorQ family protein [Gemmatimonadales bacterium]
MTRFFTPRLVLSALLVGAIPAGVAAQDLGGNDNTGFGTTAAEFLLIGANARGTALGGSYAAMAADVGGLNANPAGIAQMTRPGAQFSQYDYVVGTDLSWGGLAFPVGNGSGAIGFQLGTFGFDDQPVFTVERPEGNGELFSVSETFAALTFAKNMSDRFSVGITAKGIFDDLGEVSGEAYAVDFGTYFHSNLNGHAVRFAFTVTNLGTRITYDGDPLRSELQRDPLPGDDPIVQEGQPVLLRTRGFDLPTTFRMALAYDAYSSANRRITVMSEFNQLKSNKAAYGFATEAAVDRIGGSSFGVALRGSYSDQPANTTETDFFGVKLDNLKNDEKLQGLAFGGGLTYDTPSFLLGFDYAWKKLGLLGNTNFFTVTVGWK